MKHLCPTPNRRTALSATLACLLPAGVQAAPAATPAERLAALERRVGGRLGVTIFDTGSAAGCTHRSDERFGMCSTFKLPLAALVLRQIERGRLKGDQWVPYTQADLVAHAPVTRAQLGRGGMTVAALAHAAQTTSDNAAANLLLALIGGPEGFTAQLRELGDEVTRLDRMEPAMNHVAGPDPRDTTTPTAMARTVARFLTGDGLPAAAQARLAAWMVETQTGARRLRAGLPRAWRAGDKTGTGMDEGMVDKYNDIAIVWPVVRRQPRAPVVIAAFYETAQAHGQGMRDADQAVLAEVGRIAARWITDAGAKLPA